MPAEFPVIGPVNESNPPPSFRVVNVPAAASVRSAAIAWAEVTSAATATASPAAERLSDCPADPIV